MKQAQVISMDQQLPVIGKFLPTMQPSYATPEEVMKEHGGETFADVKYDGYRVQVHKSDFGVVIYTRNGNELNYSCYPDILEAVVGLPIGIFEAELVGHGSSHKEVFDNVRKRFRKPGLKKESIDAYLGSGIVQETPLSLRVFDAIRWENTGTLYLPFEQRRSLVEKLDDKGVKPAETQRVQSLAELESLLTQTFAAQQEGRVCKNPSSLYVPGQQSLDWVKFKRSETLDLVIVGFYKEESYANGLPFTSVLCATYNDQTGRYETLGKIGVTRNGLANEINAQVAGKLVAWRSKKVVFSDKLDRPAYNKFAPDKFIDPDKSVVLEVKAMNLHFADNWQTCGYEDNKAFSMRIGFAQQLRPDKSPRQSTKTSVVRKLYELQEGDAK